MGGTPERPFRGRDAFEERRRAAIVASLLSARAPAAPIPDEGKARILPVLHMGGALPYLSLKLGRERLYAVRDLFAFAARMASGETYRYGKLFSFRHSLENFMPEDAPFLRLVLLLLREHEGYSSDEIPLSSAAMDAAMRLLLGRTVLLRTRSVEIPARVVEGEAKLTVSLADEPHGAKLRVNPMEACEGDAGAYFPRPDTGEIVCVFGEAHARIAGLIDLGWMYPRGVRLTREELSAVVARVLIPARDALRFKRGEALLDALAPSPMRVFFLLDGDARRLACRVQFRYGGGDGSANEPGAPDEAGGEIRRDLAREQDALAAAAALFPEALAPDEFALSGSADARFAALRDCGGALKPLGEVMASERLLRMDVSRRRTMTFGVAPNEAGTLILRADLGGFSGAELAEAAAAYREKRRYVLLPDGAFLSGEALAQAAEAASLLDALGKTPEALAQGVPVDEPRLAYLDAALRDREMMRLDAPEAQRAFLERLRKAGETRVAPPQGLRATLRPYQETGLSWLQALTEAGFGALLADDMGLGKTLQALSLLLSCLERGETVRAIVVCPASLQLNWLREAERFTPGLVCRALTGGRKERENLLHEPGAHLIVTSYDQLRRDVELYRDETFTHALLDEAQQVKNASSQAAKAVRTLRAARRIAMTGTPVENRLAELWAAFDFLMPGYLGPYKRFRERFELPAAQGDERAMSDLRALVSPFILRRLKRDVLSDLPEKVETVLTSEMTPAQRKQYAAAAARLTGEAGDLKLPQERMRALAGLTRLRQICCDPRLCLEGYAGGSGKLAQCVELAASCAAAGHRMLVFSQFTSMLALLKDALEAAGLTTLTLTGETEKGERQRRVDAFNAGEGDAFLISLKAGGTGLNLTGADTVIHYDPWWNTAAHDQAADRAYRIGQTRGVQVFDLIAAASVEERIRVLQEKKRALGEGVLEGAGGALDAQTLADLLRNP